MCFSCCNRLKLFVSDIILKIKIKIDFSTIHINKSVPHQTFNPKMPPKRKQQPLSDAIPAIVLNNEFTTVSPASCYNIVQEMLPCGYNAAQQVSTPPCYNAVQQVSPCYQQVPPFQSPTKKAKINRDSPEVTQQVQCHQAVQSPARKMKTAPEEYFFGLALQKVISKRNQFAGYEYVSLREECPMEWSIMGTINCELILVKLDSTFKSFDLISLLPWNGDIHWCFCNASKDKDIDNSLSALFV